MEKNMEATVGFITQAALETKGMGGVAQTEGLYRDFVGITSLLRYYSLPEVDTIWNCPTP